MKPRHLLLIVFAAIAMALTVVIARIPYFAGDMTLAKVLQAALPRQTAWAEWITATAKWPWLIGLMVLSGLIAAVCTGSLMIGLGARVALGAYWPSDVVVSYLYGFVIAAVLVEFIPRRRR